MPQREAPIMASNLLYFMVKFETEKGFGHELSEQKDRLRTDTEGVAGRGHKPSRGTKGQAPGFLGTQPDPG